MTLVKLLVSLVPTCGDSWDKVGHSLPSLGSLSTTKNDGSLFHVYNILTGAVTHKPEYRDTDGTYLKGRVLSMDAVTDRLGTIHNMLTDLAAKADEDGDITGALETVPMFSEIIY